jgi:hypothetical protein
MYDLAIQEAYAAGSANSSFALRRYDHVGAAERVKCCLILPNNNDPRVGYEFDFERFALRALVG